MEGKNNQDIFNEAMARILGHLWFSHPVPFNFDQEGMLKAFPDLSQEEVKIYGHTVEWLHQEGFLHRDHQELHLGRISGKVYGRATLTLTGMTLLGQTLPSVGPENGQDKRSFGQVILDLLKDGAKDTASTLVREVFLGLGKAALGMPQ